MKIPIPCTRIGLCNRETCQMQHVEDMNNITTRDNETSPVTEKPHFIQDKQNSKLDFSRKLVSTNSYQALSIKNYFEAIHIYQSQLYNWF